MLSRLGREREAYRDLRRSKEIEARENLLQRSLGAAALNAQMQIERIDEERRSPERTVAFERELGVRRTIATRLSLGIALASLALSLALIALLASRTRHQRAMQHAAESLETHARVIHTVREGVLLIDDQGGIEFANPALLRLLGREGADLRGLSIEELGFSAGDLGEQVGASVAELPEAGRELRWRARDGEERVLMLTGSTLTLNDRRVHIYVMQDVTERRRLELEVLQIASAERDRLSH